MEIFSLSKIDPGNVEEQDRKFRAARENEGIEKIKEMDFRCGLDGEG